MKQKIKGILLCMLLIIISALSVSGSTNIINPYKESYVNHGDLIAPVISRNHIILDWSEQKLISSDGTAGDEFGYPVSIYGDYAIIGAPHDDDNGKDSGSVYILRNTGTSWVEEQKLTASDGAESDLFGYYVSISGDYAIIGAPYDDDMGSDSGSAYIFKNNGTSWVEEQKLTASDGAESDLFGFVFINGDYAIIGAPYDDDMGSNSGSAYIYKNIGTSWVEEQKLHTSHTANFLGFGVTISINEEYAIIGAPYDDDMGSNSGSVYIFKNNGTSWIEEQKLFASDSAADDVFGRCISMDGLYIIIGAPHDDDNGKNSGSAYIFKNNGTSWVEQQKLTASDGAAEDYFGRRVSIDSNYAVIGAENDDDNGKDSGSVYIFNCDDTRWVEDAKLLASDGEDEDLFASSVSIDGNSVIVGAPFDNNSNGVDAGSVYIFERINYPPDKPTISGPNSGNNRVKYCWTFHSNDSDGDNVKYYIDWGDDNSNETDFNPPCVPVEVCHIYEEQGEYNITAYAQDINGLASEESTLQVTIPKPRVVYHHLFLKLFERFQNLFLKLRYILVFQ